MKSSTLNLFQPVPVVAGVLLLLAGCSGMGSYSGLTFPVPPEHPVMPANLNIPRHSELQGLAAYSEPNQSGPSALALAFTYAGKSVTPNEAAELVNLPAGREATQDEMLAAARQMGLLPYVLNGKLWDLLTEVAAGHPVIVMQNSRYALLTGYDIARGFVMLDSGQNRRQVMALNDFDSAWALNERWAMLAMKPAIFPATVQEANFVAAAESLEPVVPEAARVAYEAALLRWPNDLGARMGLGNVAYRLYRAKEAEAQYRQATVEHPQSGDAWNALALVLHEQGRNREALYAVIRAVSIGGDRSAEYAATLDAIQKERHWESIE
jgi:tetratricopeptide (TPR) repeat protein